MEHTTTVTTEARQLGRTRVTDYLWYCSCGEKGKAPHGFRSEREARLNSLAHRR